jgi:hypothetical protein
LSYVNYGSMDKTGEQNGLPVDLGTFTPTVMMASVGYGQWIISGLALGGTVKYISQTIDTESYSAVAFDLGGLWETGVKGLNAGFVVQNIGTQLAGSNLPFTGKVGAAYALPWLATKADQWLLAADVVVPFGDTTYTSFNLGTEYMYNEMLGARAGYKTKNSGDVGGLSGLTAGVSFKISVFTFDWALGTYGDLGMTNQIAITASFR